MNATWAEHCCRQCFGTLLERRDGPDARPVFECGTCSLQAVGEPNAICGCGILPRPVRAASGPRFRCAPNPVRGPAATNLLVIAYDEASA